MHSCFAVLGRLLSFCHCVYQIGATSTVLDESLDDDGEEVGRRYVLLRKSFGSFENFPCCKRLVDDLLSCLRNYPGPDGQANVSYLYFYY